MKGLFKKRFGKSRTPAKHLHGKKRKRAAAKLWRKTEFYDKSIIGEIKILDETIQWDMTDKSPLICIGSIKDNF